MQPSFPPPPMLHGRHQHRMREELAVLNHQVNAGDVHMHDATRANVEMPYFAVAHLTLRQANKRSAGVNERVGIFAQQAVIGGFASQRDGIRLGFGAVSPAVEDDKNERFRSRHFSPAGGMRKRMT